MKDSLLLKVSHLDAGYGGIQVLWDINLEVRQKEVVCIIGANGAGKSTLLKSIVGMIPIRKGEIFYSGDNITEMAGPKRIKMGLGFAPEGRHLFFGLTVEDNLLMGAFQRKLDHSVREDLDFVYTLFKPLKGYSRKLAGNLSGGEQQMCAIGRALMSHPNLLIIDELSLGLAPVVVDDLIDIVGKLRNDRGIGILLVEQDVKVALDMADRGYVLEAGAVSIHDSAAGLARNEHIRGAYLGEI
jgi:branched-chain amino acid transport system ATP-binding protein